MAINPQTGQRMGRAAIITRLKALSKVRVKSVDIDDHIKRLKAESDRGVMILAATLIDDALLTVLEPALKWQNREMRDKIFHGDGPLAAFSRRIDFSIALGLIGGEISDTLHAIREVRNVAAHAHVDVDFTTPEVKWTLGTMLPHEHADDFETWPRVNVRNFYLHICGILADQIVGVDDGPLAIHGFFRTLHASDYNAPPP